MIKKQVISYLVDLIALCFHKVGDTLLAIRCEPILLVVTPVNGNEITIGNDLINEHCRHMLY